MRSWLIILPMLLAGCEDFLDVPPPGRVIDKFHFVEATEEVGITGSGPSFGVGWGDVDGDGLVDLWSGNHAEPPSLYLNQGDGTFSESREAFFALGPDTVYDAHGVNFVDLEGDGDLDLLESVGGARNSGIGRNRVHVADGGVFTDRAAELGLSHESASGRCPIAYDFNGDGRLDIFWVAQPAAEGADPSALFTQLPEGPFVLQREIAAEDTIPTALCGQLADLDGDHVPEVLRFGRPGHIRAFSTADGDLTDLSAELGLPSPTLPFDVVVGDFDNDLQNDLFISRWQELSDYRIDEEAGEIDLALRLLNGMAQGVAFSASGEVEITLNPSSFWSPSMIYLGADCSRFTGSIEDMRITVDASSEDIAGHCDLPVPDTEGMFVGYSEGRFRVVLSAPVFNRGNITVRSEGGLVNVERLDLELPSIDAQREYNRDRLFFRRADGFRDEGWGKGIQDPTTCTSVAAADFDNDMDLDLYMVCATPVGNTENLMYENNGRGAFSRVEDHGAEGTILGRGDTVVVADYDEDGDLDLFVSNGYAAEPFNRGPRQLFRNDGLGYHWLEIDLEATSGHPAARGAVVHLTAGGVTQMREMNGGTHHMGQHDTRLHFGLGRNTEIDELRVFWPGGAEQVFDVDGVDQILTVVEL